MARSTKKHPQRKRAARAGSGDGKPQRSEPLSRERVVAAAIALANVEGIEALTMRRLAASLGVEAMSLYHHVKNKETLLDAMVEQVVGEFAVPDSGADWKREMHRRALSAHRVLMAYPWASLLILSRVNTGPGMLAWVDATLGCLRVAGFSWAASDHASNAMDNHLYGFTLQALNFPFDPSEYAEAARTYLPAIPKHTYPHLNGLACEIAEKRHDGVQDFEFGLALILDGLERYREHQSS